MTPPTPPSTLLDAKRRAAQHVVAAYQRRQARAAHEAGCECAACDAALEAAHEAKLDFERMMARFAADPEIRKHMTCWMVDFHGSEAPSWATEERLPSAEEAAAAIAGGESSPAQLLGDWLERHGFHVSDSGAGSTGWDMGVPCTDEEMVRLTTLVAAWQTALKGETCTQCKQPAVFIAEPVAADAEAYELGALPLCGDHAAGGWYPKQLWQLTAAANHARYVLGAHLAAGTLTVSVNFWGWSFADVRYWADAEALLNAQ